jgi:hypothetical protein
MNDSGACLSGVVSGPPAVILNDGIKVYGNEHDYRTRFLEDEVASR